MSDPTDASTKGLLKRSKEMMERIKVRFRDTPGFASDIGANFFDYLLEDLTKYEGRSTALDSQLDVAMGLLRDNKSPMHFDREMTQADHDVLREARKWQ